MSGKQAMNRVQQMDEWRKKIQASQLLNRLREHAMGNVEMTRTQVAAAKVLLGKVVPDLKAIEHSGRIDSNREAMTDAELDAEIERLQEKRNA